MQALWIFLAGIVGTGIRWLLVSLFDNKCMNMGTLTANLIGCFLIGIVLGLFENKVQIPEHQLNIIKIGFLGSLTTFSGFSYEVVSGFIAQHYLKSCIILLSHVIGSLSITYIGFLSADLLSKRIN